MNDQETESDCCPGFTNLALEQLAHRVHPPTTCSCCDDQPHQDEDSLAANEGSPQKSESVTKLQRSSQSEVSQDLSLLKQSFLTEHGDQPTLNSDEHNLLNLSRLPTSVLLIIFSHIPATHLVKEVSLVCKRFFDLIDDTFLWKSRIFLSRMKPYPIVPLEEEKALDVQFWQESAVEQEHAHRKWATNEFTYEKFTYTEPHYSELDSLWLSDCGRFCYTGGRDRQIVLWDLVEHKMKWRLTGHAGWVWDIIGLNNQCTKIVSASWDYTVKFWDSQRECCYLTRKVKSPALSLAQISSHPDIVFYSLFNRTIGRIDCRAPDSQQENISSRDHRKSVLCLQPYRDNYLFSGSEDAFIKCFDIRQNNQVLRQVKLPNMVLSMHCNDEHLLATTKDGNIYCYNPFTLEGPFVLEGVHEKSVMCVSYTKGCILSGSADKTVQIMEPCVGGECLATLTDHSESVTNLAYKNKVLATVSADQSMIAYTPAQIITSHVH